MSYTKHNFQKGDVLTAAALNEMDEQINQNEEKIAAMGKNGAYYTPSVDTEGNLTWTPSAEGMTAVSGANIKGEKGDPGEKGAKGDAFTYDDFTPEQLAALKGDKGDTGATGATGAAGKDGSDASVTVENIAAALGYTPADEKEISKLSEDKYTSVLPIKWTRM